MDKHYRYKLMQKQLEGERDEVQRIREALRLAFDDVLELHNLVARGELDEEAIAKLPRALHLFRSYARDLLGAYEDHIAPCDRDLGRPVPDYWQVVWHRKNDIPL